VKTVFVGLSGGVDSSVAAYLIKNQGYQTVGVYMKNWSKSLPGFDCPWKQDYQDAKRVAVQLGIDFLMFDFEKDYQHQVVDYMIDEFKAGNTPNPDIMCNQEVKFKLFLDTAIEQGADVIATGHYSKIKNNSLFMATDQSKDQSYFLYRVTKEALERTVFPLENLTKKEVRQIAAQQNLITATKKESMGICFVGKVGIKEFLQNYVKTKTGVILDQFGKEIGQHDGAIFYTIGQRHGLDVGGGLPYYVVGKDMAKNEVYVTTQLDDKRLWKEELDLTNLHWINDKPKINQDYQVRIRHRAPLINCHFQNLVFNKVILKDPIKAATPGQSAVIYDGEKVLGGGVVV
jgi:tRNA-specific 2-thiouridylase